MIFLLASVVFGSLAFTQVLEAKVTSCNCGWVNQGRIIGGWAAGQNKYPYMALLTNSAGHILGAGTILTAWHVLTAAQITYKRSTDSVRVQVGVYNKRDAGVNYFVQRIHNHEKYDPKKYRNDIALIETSTMMVFSTIVGPACLPNARLELKDKIVRALGWGITERKGKYNSDIIRAVDLKVTGHRSCYSHYLLNWAKPDSKTTICTYAEGKDTCKGDAGGPLLWLDPEISRYTVVGLISNGKSCATSTPGVNTDVSAYVYWIVKRIQDTQPSVEACTKN